MSQVRVGIIGLGRSGWGIHADILRQMGETYRIVAVQDVDRPRMEQSRKDLGCRGYDNLDGLLGDQEVELVVVASLNALHGEHAMTAMRAGKHVVCEKPIAFSVKQLDEMIDVGQRAGVLLAPFQQRRYEPHFQKVKEVIDSGILGKIVIIRMAWHGFKRRWDWQTLQGFRGGELFNNGPHPIDHAMELFGPATPEVFCQRRRGLSSGDAEDHVKIVLSAKGAPTIDVEVSSLIAFAQKRWLVAGTAGGLEGDEKSLRWKWVDWSTMPPRPTDPQPTPDRGYNRETLKWNEAAWEMPTDGFEPRRKFYEDLYGTLRQGKPLVITPQSVRRRVAVLEECARTAPIIDA